jgi:hypothetical protein
MRPLMSGAGSDRVQEKAGGATWLRRPMNAKDQ